VALLGVALVLIVAGVAGGVWAWKSGRASSNAASEVQPPKQPAEEQGAAPTEAVARADTPGKEQQAAPSEPVAGTDTPAEDPENLSDNQTTEQPEPEPEPGGEPQEPEVPQDTAPPPDRLEPGCYAAVVAFESSRQADGRYEPWMPKSVNSRTSVKCAAVPRQANINQSRGLFDNWPDASWGKPLHYSPKRFEPQKKGEPNTRRMVVKVHTRVSESAP
jgi:hypothetical protein